MEKDIKHELLEVLKLVDRGFKSGRLPDQSIIPGKGSTPEKMVIDALSDIVSQAIAKAEAANE